MRDYADKDPCLWIVDVRLLSMMQLGAVTSARTARKAPVSKAMPDDGTVSPSLENVDFRSARQLRRSGMSVCGARRIRTRTKAMPFIAWSIG